MWTSRFAPCPHVHRPRPPSTIVIVGFHTKRRRAVLAGCASPAGDYKVCYVCHNFKIHAKDIPSCATICIFLATICLYLARFANPVSLHRTKFCLLDGGWTGGVPLPRPAGRKRREIMREEAD